MRRHPGRPESSRAAPGLAARRGALFLIASVLDRGAMLHDAGLTGEAAERAEAHGLADLTLRRLGQVDDALGRLVERLPAPPVGHVLRLMAAELMFAGTAPHAAVDLAVRLVKGAKGGARFAGLVNAVGRRLAAEGAAIAAGQDEARLNTPRWLWRALRTDWGEAGARAIAGAHLVPAPVDLTPREAAGAARRAAELGAELLPTGSLRLPGRPQVSALPGYEAGAWWVQDAAAALAARLLPAGGSPGGAHVLDLCAAPGGKTMQLAAAGARVTALDLSARRMEWVRENLARTGLAVELVVADALEWAPAAPFDAVLIDAPCSATGTIRRHPDLVWRPEPDLGALTSLQARLLERAVAWVQPGGVLVFCTCSLIRAEGEAQARRFLETAPGFERLPVTPGEAGIPAEFLTPAGDVRTRPDFWAGRGGLDGFFVARFRRRV